jgi:tryptophanyl-tRNA synthetase
MAADILLYRATHVPVGEDQKQHLELTRDIAQKFNIDFSDRIRAAGLGVEMMVGEEKVSGFFPMTEPLIDGPAPRVMSLRDGSKKMSKSEPSDLSRINHDRRCRHDRQEDPQGQDRSSALARNPRGARRPARGAKTWSASTPR